MTDAPHRLLLGHFRNWSQTKRREVDVQLLEDLLDLRANYDDLEPTLWPAGSVQDLLLRLLPAKGPTEPLPPDATVDALDAYFRFLRNTGRMSARSAAPADLSREARRSAKKMAAAARDRANWSPGKSLIDFGASIGIGLDDVSSVDEMQERLNQIAAAWNALPIHKRQQLDPPNDNLSGRSRAKAVYQTDDEVAALIKAFSYELPQGELPSPAEIAPIIRESKIFAQLEALTRWIEPRAEVTATGVLRPAAARQAFDDLGLAAWWREYLRRDYAEDSSPEEMEIFLDLVTPTEPWRSARDCLPLDRLWNAALTCDVIRIEGRWSYPSWPGQLNDEDTVTLGLRAGLSVLISYLESESAFALPVLGYALLRSYVRQPRSVPMEEIEEFVLSWTLTPSQRADADLHDLYHRLIRSTLRRSLYGLDDLAIFSQTENEIALTSWGDVFVASWLGIEMGEPRVEG